PVCFHSGACTESTRGSWVPGIPPSCPAPPLAPENSPDAGGEMAGSSDRFPRAPANVRSIVRNRTAVPPFERSADSPFLLSLSPDRHRRIARPALVRPLLHAPFYQCCP